MPRKACIDAPGALHHIIVRGIERQRIFSNDQGRDNLIERLAAIATETQTVCFGWELRKLGFSATELSVKLGVSQPSVSISVKRGEKIAQAGQLKLIEE